MIRCLSCGSAETTNGLALCELCQRLARTILQYLPIYFRNLARWRPGRAGSRLVPGSRVLYDGWERGSGTGDRISDRLDEAANMLVTRARELVDDRPGFVRPLTMSDAVLTREMSDEVAADLADDHALTVAWLCVAFEDHLTSIATLDWCGDFVRDLSQYEAALRGLTETLVPGWYAGACNRRVSMEAACGASTYVVPGLTWVTCGACGATTHAADHLETILSEARGWVAPPKRVAEALVALLDSEQSVERLYDRIRKWESLGWIEGHRRKDADGDPVGPKRYRLGDVLDRVQHADTPELAERMTPA